MTEYRENTYGIPTLPARREGVHLVVLCPHCRIEHVHGACASDHWKTRRPCTCPPGCADGPVSADCVDWASPYRGVGYFVRETR